MYSSASSPLGQHAPREERLASLECLRVVAILGVISQHMVSPELFQKPGTTVNIVMCLVEQLRIFAVPFFFLVSGYFFGKSIQAGKSASDVLVRYAKWFAPVWLVWTILYAFIPSNWGETDSGVLRPMYWQFLLTIDWITLHPFAFLWFMPPGHQWFLPALIVGLTTVAFLHSFNLMRVGLPVAAVLYLTGVVLRGEIFVLQPLPLPSFLTMELAVTLLFTLSGWWLSFHLKKPNLKLGVLLATTGYILALFEAAAIWHHIDSGLEKFTTGQPMLGTIPLTLGIFLIALAKPDLGRSTMLPSLAKLTFGVYMSHMLVIRALNPVRTWLDPPFLLWDMVMPFVVYLLAISLTVILSRVAITNAYLIQVKGAVHLRGELKRGIQRVAQAAARA